ncbi:MAG: hypothetical protein AAGC47_04205 [Bacteroidota bacterium]
MKTSKLLIAAFCITTQFSFGQLLVGNLIDLQTSGNHFLWAEIEVGVRSEKDLEKYKPLDSQVLLIPNRVDQKNIKPEYRRFRVVEGNAFMKDGKNFIKFHVLYDAETTDPRDDLHIAIVVFQVKKKHIINHLSRFDGEKIAQLEFSEAKMGIPVYELDNQLTGKK